MFIVSCRYFIRGDTAWTNITSCQNKHWLDRFKKSVHRTPPCVTSSLLMESGDRLMCWMYLRSSGCICMEIFYKDSSSSSTFMMYWSLKNQHTPQVWTPEKLFVLFFTPITHTSSAVPCRWAQWWGAWPLSAGPGPCCRAARSELCKPALCLPLRMTPPWPAPHQASPGPGAGGPGKHAHAPCCSGKCRAEQKARSKGRRRGRRWRHRKGKARSIQIPLWKRYIENQCLLIHAPVEKWLIIFTI